MKLILKQDEGMSKIVIYLGSLLGALSVFADIPIFMVFGGVYIVILLELKKIEKKANIIFRTLYGSVFAGWGASFGVKHFRPELMEGDIRIFSMLLTTLFSYGIALYFVKNETLSKWLDKKLNKKEDENISDN